MKKRKEPEQDPVDTMMEQYRKSNAQRLLMLGNDLAALMRRYDATADEIRAVAKGTDLLGGGDD